MRWRIRIGLMVLLIGAAGVYWFANPRKGGVEYHKQGYLEALAPSMIPPLIHDMMPSFRERQTRRVEFHLQALIDAGYLGQKVYLVSNRPPFDIATNLLTKMATMNTNTEAAAFHHIRHVKSNSVTIVGPPAQLHQWDEWVRDADAPRQ